MENLGKDEAKISLPVWAIVGEQKHAKVGLPTSTAILKDKVVDDYLPIFSTRELALACIDRGLSGHVPLKLEAVAEFRDLLVSLLAVGVQHLGIDTTATGGKWIHISIVLDKIIAKLN